MKLADRPVVRAAFHEAGHAVAAYIYRLPLSETWIDAEGYGKTRYTRRFDLPDIEAWLVATLAGPAIELQIWGSAPLGGDSKVIAAMVRDMELEPWSDEILDRYRRAAGRSPQAGCNPDRGRRAFAAAIASHDWPRDRDPSS
jgi:hypothetical protein